MFAFCTMNQVIIDINHICHLHFRSIYQPDSTASPFQMSISDLMSLSCYLIRDERLATRSKNS